MWWVWCGQPGTENRTDYSLHINLPVPSGQYLWWVDLETVPYTQMNECTTHSLYSSQMKSCGLMEIGNGI